MPGSQPVFSVVIPVFNDADGLLACLEALARQTLGADSFEVLVVDNGSDVLPMHVVRKFPFARMLEEGSPGSYAARNRGCREARGVLLGFTDADCRPAADWLERALAHFESKRGTSAIGGRIELERRVRPSAAELYEAVFAFRQEKYVLEENFAATANMLVRRVVFDQVGAFNDELRSSGDREWGGRLFALGHTMVYADDVIVVHPPRNSLRELVRRRRRLEGGFAAVGSRTRGGGRAPGARNRSGLKLAATLVFTPCSVGIGVIDAMKVIGVAGFLGMVGLVELVRLQLGGSARR